MLLESENRDERKEVLEPIKKVSIFMMYPFMTLDDNTEIVHSEILENGSLQKKEEYNK